MIHIMKGMDKKQLAVAIIIIIPTVVPSKARPIPSSSDEKFVDRLIPPHVLSMAIT